MSTGNVITYAGVANVPGFFDGNSSSALFSSPQGIAIDPTGSYALISDTYNHAVRCVDLVTGDVRTLAGNSRPGFSDGTSATFHDPVGVAWGASGSILVIDQSNIAVRSISLVQGMPPQLATVTTLVQSPAFKRLNSLAMNAAGSVILTTESHAVYSVNIVSGMLTAVAGSRQLGYADGQAALFNSPTGVALNAIGSVALVADYNNFAVRLIDVSTWMVTTLAGNASVSGSSDGVLGQATFKCPLGIAMDRSGSIALIVSWFLYCYQATCK